jgi:hypothetical protein
MSFFTRTPLTPNWKSVVKSVKRKSGIRPVKHIFRAGPVPATIAMAFRELNHGEATTAAG